MARGGHRVLSAGTKAKIAASLRGNKNAFRGGPKKRLTSREKVANINARTKANKVNLSDAQLRQRAAVAKRLRARARAEEAGIKPAHSKPIPTPNTIAKRNVEVKENDALAKNKVAKIERSFTRAGRGKQQINSNTAKSAAKTRTPLSPNTMGHMRAVERRINAAEKSGRINSTQANQAKRELSNRIQSRISRDTDKRIAAMQTGKGSFSKKENTHSSNNTAVMRRRVTELNNQKIAKHREEINTLQGMLAGNKNGLSLIKRQDDLRKKISDLQSHNADIAKMGKRKAANRSKPSTDPLTKATSKPKSLPAPGSDVRIGNGNARYTVLQHFANGKTVVQSTSSFGGRKPGTRTIETIRLKPA